MAFLVLHILTSVLDSFAPISLLDAFVPFTGSYRPFWLGLGAVSFDLLLAVTITSLLRRRIGYGTWRAVHWLTYASWPIALLHGFGTGSDVKSGWLLVLSIGCLAIVLAAVLARVLRGWPANLGAPRRGARRHRRLLAVPAAVAARRAARLRMGAALGHARPRCSRPTAPRPPPAAAADELPPDRDRAAPPRGRTARRDAAAAARRDPADGAMSLEEHLRGARPDAAPRARRRRRDRDEAARLIDEIERAGLLGRGGAAFPDRDEDARGRRARAGARSSWSNGAEGEPASLKDRTLMASLPHLVLDGAMLAAEAVGADEVIVCVCESALASLEGMHARDRGTGALARGPSAASVRLVEVPGDYVAGQESALVNHLERRRRDADVHAADALRAGRPAPPDADQQRRDARTRRADRPPRRGVVPPARDRRPAGVGARDAVRPRRPPRRLRDRARRVAELADRGRRRCDGAYTRRAAGRLRRHLDRRRAAARCRARRTNTSPPTAPRSERASCCCSPRTPARSPRRRASARWLAAQSAGQCGPCVHGLDALAATLRADRRR